MEGKDAMPVDREEGKTPHWAFQAWGPALEYES